MATTALAQEKIWLDKSSYDKAERLHHEKLSKVLLHKIMDDNNILHNTSATIELEPLIDTNSEAKSKSKKVVFDLYCKLAAQNNATTEATKNSKNSKKNNSKKEVVKIYDNTNVSNGTVGGKKFKAKEAKEKKNKADKKHRNLEEDKSNVQENKEQLPSQGSQPLVCSNPPASGSLASEVAKALQHMKQSLQCMDHIASLHGMNDSDLVSRVVSLEKENQNLQKIVQELKSVVSKLDSRVNDVEGRLAIVEGSQSSVPVLQICPQKPPAKEDDDEDVDLFGSDSEGEDAEAAKIREERLAAYAAKKSKKPTLIAKSNIILDVKPWDDETDMSAMEAEVRKIQMDGLLWGAAKLVPVAFNIKKLQISCVVEDDKVSVDALTEQIQEIEDFVQSVDIAAFNKV